MAISVEPLSFGAYLRHLRERKGLGRTEFAMTSKTSFSYVTKLEQGAAEPPSRKVVDRLAAAVDASSQERQHLHDLVAYHRGIDSADPTAHEVTDLMRQHADNLAPNLAGYADEAWNVLYCNAEYRRIFRHIDDPAVANVLSWFFRVPESRAIMLEWEAEARFTVAWLRALMARHPASPLFEPLLDELSQSPDFVRMWELREISMGRHTPHMLIHDLDTGQDMRLIVQVYDWSDPTRALQLHLGVRDRGAGPRSTSPRQDR